MTWLQPLLSLLLFDLINQWYHFYVMDNIGHWQMIGPLVITLAITCYYYFNAFYMIFRSTYPLHKASTQVRRKITYLKCWLLLETYSKFLLSYRWPILQQLIEYLLPSLSEICIGQPQHRDTIPGWHWFVWSLVGEPNLGNGGRIIL